MACRVAVVKLGGSAITDKSTPETVRWDVLESASSQLARFASGGGRLAVVHGGGSFGHYIVSDLLSRRGRLGPAEVSAVQREMLLLAMAVLDGLTSKGVPASLHAAHSMCTGERVCDLTPMVRDLERGLVPLTYGDAVLTGSGGVVVSGDTIAALMASKVKADCLIYVSDVEGVIGVDGKTMRRVSPRDLIASLEGGGVDVTGGMRRKIAEAASAGVPNTRVVRWDRLLDALSGADVGTLVVP
ncbi:MAG: isopentenyl phosphate kinase [Acidilobus sp.]